MKLRTLRPLPALGAALLVLQAGFVPSWAQSGGTSAWSKLGPTPASLERLLVDPSNASNLYALGGDGVSRSTDSGQTWSLCARGARDVEMAPPASPTGTVTLLEVGPEGLRKSTDGCSTWVDVPSSGLVPSASNVRWVDTYPNNASTVYAGMDGLGGLYRSTDSGASWQAASRGLPAGAWATAFAADPQKPERVFVGLEYASRDHPPAFVYRSTDGGITWRSASLGMHLLPNNDGKVVGLAWTGGTLLAATAEDGLFASTDRGTSWETATLPRSPGQVAGDPGAMPLAIRSIASTKDGVVVVSTAQGAYLSADGALSWQSFGPRGAPQRPVTALNSASGLVVSEGDGLYDYTIPAGSAALPRPSPTAGTVAQLEPTAPPPPSLPSPTPAAPTATSTPIATPTAPPPPRPAGWLPSDKAQPVDPSVGAYFPETGHNIKYGFKDYWLNNDGPQLLGFPLTEEFVENGTTVQYFERARLEYHNGNIGWGLLGTELTKGQFFRPIKFFPSEDTDVYFGPTQHSLSGPFLTFWRDNGGLATFGYPISESFNDDGSDYQWFERARFEWHPWFPEGQKIVLGLIGKEALQKKGWIK